MRRRIVLAAAFLALAIAGAALWFARVQVALFGPRAISVALGGRILTVLILGLPAVVAAGWTARELRAPLALAWSPRRRHADDEAGDAEALAAMLPGHGFVVLAGLTAPLAILGVLLATGLGAVLPAHGHFGAGFVAIWMALPVGLRGLGLLLGAWVVAPGLPSDARWMRRHAAYGVGLLVLVIGYLVGLMASEVLLHASGRQGFDIDRPNVMSVLFYWSAVYLGAIVGAVIWWRRRP